MRPSSFWWSRGRRAVIAAALLAVFAGVLAGCSGEGDTLTVYSGRTQSLVHPLLESFAEDTGIAIGVKYAGSSAITSTILEEGDNTPADVVFLQDPGSLGALAQAGFLEDVAGRTPR